ncbi:hypothetical protein ACFQVC_18780 [Streptomyces monticola]|uniref:Uncharacterized protein n=1 Tax=Streptomyces monticola TaxID=2666263 RepID=A0ABW2JKV0_9ACTN
MTHSKKILVTIAVALAAAGAAAAPAVAAQQPTGAVTPLSDHHLPAPPQPVQQA